jgi:hypothetical protein
MVGLPSAAQEVKSRDVVFRGWRVILCCEAMTAWRSPAGFTSVLVLPCWKSQATAHSGALTAMRMRRRPWKSLNGKTTRHSR